MKETSNETEVNSGSCSILRVPLFAINVSSTKSSYYRLNSHFGRHCDQSLTLHESISDFVYNHRSKLVVNKLGNVTLYSELHESALGYAFRAHPNYRSEGPWYDWAGLTYIERDAEVNVPAKLLGFLENPNDSESPFMICHTCEFQDNKHIMLSSQMFEHWQLQFHEQSRYMVSQNGIRESCTFRRPLYQLEDMSILRPHLFGVEIDGALYSKRFVEEPVEQGQSLFTGDFDVIVAKDREEYWPCIFLDQVRSVDRKAATLRRYKKRLNVINR